jgi:DNA-binding response OmpR family regulator
MGGSSDSSVLVLEDEAVIALDVEDILQSAGFTDVVTISSRADAERWLSEHTPHIAVIDAHLRDGMCIEVIQTLTERNVPFVIHSGERPEDAEEEHGFHKGQWLAKPSRPEALFAAIKAGLAISEGTQS